MNVSGDGFGGELGDQYIPPEYTALSLPTTAQVFRALLFGSRPDRIMLNYRCQQLLALLHATELLHFVTALDPRITYDANDNSLFDPTKFQALVFPSQGTFLKGATNSPDRLGQCRRSWWLSVTDDLTMRVLRTTPPRSENIQTFSYSGNLSSDIQLPGSSLRFSFRPGTPATAMAEWRTFSAQIWQKFSAVDWNFLAARDLGDGLISNTWNIDEAVRPQYELGDIEASLRQVGEPPVLALFGIGSERGSQEPWQTFYKLWLTHTELPYSLGGLVLGLIYYTELIRQGVTP